MTPQKSLRNRVVLDTNVFVSAGFSRYSSSAHILQSVEEGRLRLVWDEGTRDEIRHILRKIPPIEWDDFAHLFKEEDRFPGPTHPEGFGSIEDPDDRKFAALAHAADAVLVSHDDHLLAHRERAEVLYLTPDEFRARWKET